MTSEAIIDTDGVIMTEGATIDQLLDRRLVLQREAGSIKIQLDRNKTRSEGSDEKDKTWIHKAKTALSYKNMEVHKIDRLISKIKMKEKDSRAIESKERSRIFTSIFMEVVKENMGMTAYSELCASVNERCDKLMRLNAMNDSAMNDDEETEAVAKIA